MRVIPRIDIDNAGGFADKVVGLGKEIVGEAFDEQRLVDAGTAQQGKGTEKLEAIRKQAKADTHRRKADQKARQERQARSAKSSAKSSAKTNSGRS